MFALIFGWETWKIIGKCFFWLIAVQPVVALMGFRPRSIDYFPTKLNIVAMAKENQAELVRSTKVSAEDILRYVRKGHIKMPHLLDKDLVVDVMQPMMKDIFAQKELEAMQHLVQVVIGDVEASPTTVDDCNNILQQQQEPVDTPFLQLFNLWRTYDEVKKIVCSPRLAEVAAQLMGVSAVRLYQDSLFVKRPGDDATAWHSDLNMVPLDTNDYITCWIPLHAVPAGEDGGSGLTYATGSHRDFSLLYWHGAEDKDLEGRYTLEDHGSYQVGDVSFHHGWCLHSAPPNALLDPRYALSISYVADGVKTLDDESVSRFPDDEDYSSYADWIEEVGWNEVVDHPRLPLIYSDNNKSTTE